MKKRIFFGGLLILFLIELSILTRFVLPRAEKPQDAVAVNEAVQTVKCNWNSLESHINQTALDYVVIDSDGAVLYRTKPNLSENMNAAISHKDTILDIETEGAVIGRIIIYNNDALLLQS